MTLADERTLRLRSAHVEPLAHQISGWLARLLADGDTFLIITVGSGNRYVQFITGDGDYLRAEVSGNEYVDAAYQLSFEELAELDRLGWQHPADEPKFIGNHWRMWEPPDVADASQLAALTLCRALGLTESNLDTATVITSRI